jgi:hypothetical protein
MIISNQTWPSDPLQLDYPERDTIVRNMKYKYYILSCYAPDAYVFFVRIRASEAWLKKTLKRKNLINGTPLTKTQFDALQTRLIPDVEACYYDKLEYFVEAVNK